MGLKLDLGCGPNTKEGFEGVDLMPFDGKVKHVFDLRQGPWPFEDNSVEEAHCSHFLEHLTNLNGKWERVRFFNELFRIMVPNGKAHLIFPHWASNRYYGDPTHKEPFSEMGFYYLDKNWRAANAPHACRDVIEKALAEFPALDLSPDGGYTCHWRCTWAYSMHQEISVRNVEFQNFALKFFKEACQDFIVTMTAEK